MQSVTGNFGTFKLINLPIGNPEDITYRAKNALEKEDFIFCEDTRNLKQLLNHYGISFENKKLISFHDHSDPRKFQLLRERITQNKNVCYVSDAGSPVISDPALPLVRFCYEEGIKVDSISGITSVINALELSGIAAQPFQFIGFLPRKESNIKECFEKMLNFEGSTVFFESPRRLEKTLEIFKSLELDYELCLVKELTKTFQSVYYFNSEKDNNDFSQIDFRGEFVGVFRSLKKSTQVDKSLVKIGKKVLSSKGKKKDLSKLLALILDKDAKELYKELVAEN